VRGEALRSAAGDRWGSRPRQVDARGTMWCWCARPEHELSIRSSRTMVMYRVETGAV